MNICNPTEVTIRQFYSNLNIGAFINQQLKLSLAILDQPHHTSLKDPNLTVVSFQEYLGSKLATSWRACVSENTVVKDFSGNKINSDMRVGNRINSSLKARKQWQLDHKDTIFDFRTTINEDRNVLYTDSEDVDEKCEDDMDSDS